MSFIPDHSQAPHYNFDQLAILLKSMNQRPTAFGTLTVTWPGASTTSSSLTFNHGMVKAPTLFFATPWTPSNFFAVLNVSTVTATQITVVAFSVSGTPTAGQTQKYSYMAII